MPASDQLEIISPGGEISFYDLDPGKGTINIGGHPDNDIVIDAPGVAPFHLVLDHSQRPYQVLLLSPNGATKLGGQALSSEEAAEVHPWDTLEIAGHSIILLRGDDAPPSEPAPTPPVPPVQEPAPAPEGVTPRAQPLRPTATRPPDQPDEIIVTELDEREWTIDVEQTAACQLTITNGGDIVATFEVRVEGLDREWITITPPQVNLNEGERATVTIAITPPREPSSRAGAHHFSVVVSSPNHPGHSSSRSATLTINPYYEFAVGELSPKQQTIGGRKPEGESVVHLANKGNSESTFVLEATDDERALSFEFEMPGEDANLAQQAQTRLPPEETFAIPVHITPLDRPLVALRSRNHSFTVTARLMEGQLTPRSLLGQLKVRPLIGPWLLALFALLLASLVVLVFRPKIYEFQVKPEMVMAGEPVTLKWNASIFSRLRLTSDTDAILPPIEENEGQVQIHPEVDQTYRLQADNLLSRLIAFFSRAEAESVVVDPVMPEIRVFSTDKESILTGETVTLRWEVLNADEVILSVNGSEEKLLSTEHTHERRVSPLQNPTNYALRATNRYGFDTDSLEITVQDPTPTPLPPPVIRRFSVAPLSVTEGQTVTLRWETEGATKAVISNLGQEYPPNGTTIHVPPQTTDYVLTALYETESKMVSTVSAPWTVIVKPKPTPTPEPQQPIIADFRAVPQEVVKGDGEQVQLVWSVDGETTNIEISGPTLSAVGNLSTTGSIPVLPSETTFYVLTAHNGDLNASQTVEVSVVEPTPTPEPPTPTPTPAPVPDIEYFVARGAEDPNDVNQVGSAISNTIKYEVVAGAKVEFSWSVLHAASVELFEDGTSLGEQPAEWVLPPRVVKQAGQYELRAANADDVSESAFIQVVMVEPEPPPPPYNLGGPSEPATPLTIQWEYDPAYLDQIVGFRVYRADAPYEQFDRVADESDLDNSKRTWDDEDPSCGQAYYVVAVYEIYEDGETVKRETDPSPDRWYSWPCPTPTP